MVLSLSLFSEVIFLSMDSFEGINCLLYPFFCQAIRPTQQNYEKTFNKVV